MSTIPCEYMHKVANVNITQFYSAVFTLADKSTEMADDGRYVLISFLYYFTESLPVLTVSSNI